MHALSFGAEGVVNAVWKIITIVNKISNNQSKQKEEK
jgi:hypothetical protein